ncbi:MAG: hypothetical protein CL878_14685 [Dehalococcoidia bacterium]|nr:hypothetical protein [Dehalococcoidia bacterium]
MNARGWVNSKPAMVGQNYTGVDTNVLGPAGAASILAPRQDSAQPEAALVVGARADATLYLEPTCTYVRDSAGRVFLQVLLRDVTEEEQQRTRLRAYAAHVVRAQEEERQRIAQELHDDTIQALILLHRQLNALEDASPALPPPALEQLRTARATAQTTIQSLRDFAWRLRPSILDDLGLVTAIRSLTTELEERATLASRLRVIGSEQRLAPNVELGLYRVAQEALRNVERHAQATQLSVAIAFAAEEVQVEVRDNGSGFTFPLAPGQSPASDHLGLLGMHERAELLGGTFAVQSTPGTGTRITVTIPVAEHRSDPALVPSR